MELLVKKVLILGIRKSLLSSVFENLEKMLMKKLIVVIRILVKRMARIDLRVDFDEKGMVGVLIPVDFVKRIRGKIIGIFEIILHVVHDHHAKVAHLAPNEGAWRESGQPGWLQDCLDPNEGARLLLTQASWLQDHVVHCL